MNTTTSEIQNESANALEYVSEQCCEVTESAKQCVGDNPVASSVVTFVAGFGIGVAIAAVMGQSDSNRRDRFASSVSNQVMNGLSGWMPKSIRR